tara:strand:- start:1298 stop:1786 length:489 start_codon:yes stop_codon:yes gene_type:complete
MATPTYELIHTETVATATSSVNFTSIPTDSSCRDFIIVIDGTATSLRPVLQFNGDTGSNYSAVMLSDDSPTYSATSSGTYLDPIPGYAITSRFSATYQVLGSNSADKHKGVLMRVNQHVGDHVHMSSGRWASNAQIVSVKVLTNNGNNYGVGTIISIYKIAG